MTSTRCSSPSATTSTARSRSSSGSSTPRSPTAAGRGSRLADATSATGSSTTARATARPSGARWPCAGTARRPVPTGLGEPEQAARAREGGAVPAGERRDLDAGAGVRGVDEAAVADVEADMADAVEEHEVAGAERSARDVAAVRELRVRRARERDAEVRVDVADEAGAVEAAAGRAASVDVA